MAIYFKCPACKAAHPSMLVQAANRQTFEGMDFRNNSEPCPKTGRQVTLNKSDLFWKDDPPKN